MPSKGKRPLKKKSNGVLVQEIQQAERDKKKMLDHNRQLAVLSGQQDAAIFAVVKIAAAALDHMGLIIAPGTVKAKKALENIMQLACPFVVSADDQRAYVAMEQSLPQSVRGLFQSFANPEFVNRCRPEVIQCDVVRAFVAWLSENETGGKVNVNTLLEFVKTIAASGGEVDDRGRIDVVQLLEFVKKLAQAKEAADVGSGSEEAEGQAPVSGSGDAPNSQDS